MEESQLESQWSVYWQYSGYALWVVNFIVIVHAIKTGRPIYWMTILLFFPGIGALAYFLIEIVPQGSLNVRGVLDVVAASLESADAKLARLKLEAEESASLKNEIAYVNQLLKMGKSDEALLVFDGSGSIKQFFDAELFGKRMDIVLRLGRAQEVLQSLDSSKFKDTTPALRRIRVEALIGAARFDEVATILEKVRRDSEIFYLGMKAKIARLGGDEAVAKKLLKELKKTYRKGNRLYRSMEAENYRRGLAT